MSRSRRACSATRRPTQTATWFDYDGDGWLDLFIGNESSVERICIPCELFHNNRDGTFTDVAKEVGVDLARLRQGRGQRATTTTTAGPISSCRSREASNVLFHNDGPQPDGRWHFTERLAPRPAVEATDPQLSGDVLRLRQRRLARPLRRAATSVECRRCRRRFPGPADGCRTRAALSQRARRHVPRRHQRGRPLASSCPAWA